MFCKKCGNQLNPSDKFCTRCGAPVETDIPNEQSSQNITAVINPITTSAPATSPIPEQAPIISTQTATPINNPFTQTITSTDTTTPQKKNRKNLFIGLIIGGVVVVLLLVGFLLYYFSGPVVFQRDSVVLTGSNYSLRMLKGWNTSVESGVITVSKPDNESAGLINKGGISYDNAKKEVDTALTNISDTQDGKITSKTESTTANGKIYIAKGSVEANGKTYPFSSYLMHDDDKGQSSWLLLTTSDKDIFNTVTGDAPYILASVQISGSIDRGLITSSNPDSLNSIVSNVNFK
jgi:hypothetical protein